MTQHIVAVDDDESVRSLIEDYLTEQGFAVTAVQNGVEMHAVMSAKKVNLVLLDVKLPDEDGFSLAREIRSKSTVPIIMLTGQNHEVDRVLGLELGADDYLTKPFSPRELLARIKAVLRRYEAGAAKSAAESEARDRRAGDIPSRRDEFRTYKFSGWELSTGTRRLLSPAGAKVELTNGEFAMLVTFLKSPMRVLSRDQLLESSRLHDDIYDRSIDVQILRLRRKIETDPNEPKLVKTERGAGYIFNSEVTF
jgi:two-component system, OmpR family, response regulator